MSFTSTIVGTPSMMVSWQLTWFLHVIPVTTAKYAGHQTNRNTNQDQILMGNVIVPPLKGRIPADLKLRQVLDLG